MPNYALGSFSGPSARPRFPQCRQLAEVVTPELGCGRRAALVSHNRSSGLARLLQQIIGERKGRTEQFAATGGSVLGKGNGGGD